MRHGLGCFDVVGRSSGGIAGSRPQNLLRIFRKQAESPVDGVEGVYVKGEKQGMFKISGTPYQQLFDSNDYTSLPVEEKVKKLEGIVLDLEEAEFNLGYDKLELKGKVTAWQVVSGFLFIFLLSFWVYG